MHTSNNFLGQIQVGQRIYNSLYGGKFGTVTAIHGEQSPNTCRRVLGGLGVMGGSARLDVAWDDGSSSTQISECLARESGQWQIYPDVVGPADVAASLARVALRKAEDKAKKEEAARARELARTRFREENPHLAPIEPGEYASAAFVAKNVRRDLKKAFPGVKFGVTSERSTINVRWNDGPTSESVRDLITRYETGYFDGMTDCYVSEPSAWNDVFGGVRYVFEIRSYSDAAVARAITEAAPGYNEEVSVENYRRGNLRHIADRINEWLHGATL